jgi:hypothetical protein
MALIAADDSQRGPCRERGTWRREPLSAPAAAESASGAKGARMTSEDYHEPLTELGDATRDMHRVLVSLMEELEAVEWHNQRVDACRDPVLRSILAHNRDEEKVHAAMLLEGIRRADGSFDRELRESLFTAKALTQD